MVEVQALVDESALQSKTGQPWSGAESPLNAAEVLHRHCGWRCSIGMSNVNVVGGVRINETAADLAVLMAVLSSHRDRPGPRDLIAFGGGASPVRSGQCRMDLNDCAACQNGFHAQKPKKNLLTRIDGLDGGAFARCRGSVVNPPVSATR